MLCYDINDVTALDHHCEYPSKELQATKKSILKIVGIHNILTVSKFSRNVGKTR